MNCFSIIGEVDRLIAKGQSTKKPFAWKSFLCNEVNKQQLNQLMYTIWPGLVTDRKATLIKNGAVYDMGLQEEVPELHSNQEETDSRVIL